MPSLTHYYFYITEHPSTHWKSHLSAGKHRPLSGDYKLYSSSASSQRQSLYANGSKDDTSVTMQHYSASKRPGASITRTHSLCNSSSYLSKLPESRFHYKSPLLQNHDSQLVLPTQALINDPRRTQTYHDFSQSIPRLDESKLTSSSATPGFIHSPVDEIETDNCTTTVGGRPGSGTKLRVRRMIQYLNQSVIDKFGQGLDSAHLQLLSSVVHSNLNFSQSEYNSVRLLNGEFCSSADQRLTVSQDNTEYVWGYDYEIINQQPLHILNGTPTSRYAQLLFQVKLNSSQSKEIVLLKVI